jgi:glutathione S-transferase
MAMQLSFDPSPLQNADMILIGQYDSPYVRRVGIALKLYDLPFTHYPWSTFGDFEKLQRYNPLVRVPTLVLDDGEVLIETLTILDYLDGLMPANRRMLPVEEPARHRALKVVALAGGVADKAVGLFYEKRLHETASEAWVQRCRAQIVAALGALEADRAAKISDYWFGDHIGHADIAVAAGLRFLTDAHAGMVDMADYPALKAHAARLEALPVFTEIAQPFIPPA